MWVIFLHVYLCTTSSAHREQKVLDPLGLHSYWWLWAAISGLGTEAGSSGRTANVINYRDISPAPEIISFIACSKK